MSYPVKNKGFCYYLGREDSQLPPTNTSESKQERKDRFIKLIKKNKWTRAELSRHLGVSRTWVTKVPNKHLLLP